MNEENIHQFEIKGFAESIHSLQAQFSVLVENILDYPAFLSKAHEYATAPEGKQIQNINFDNGKIDLAIKDLINTSMSNYYFEKIGETIVEYKKNETTPKNDKFKKNLEELVIAYNAYSSKKVKLEKVLPEELC